MGDPDNSDWQFGYEAGVSLATDPEYAGSATSPREAELSCAELAEHILGITEDGVQLWSGCVSGWLDSQ